MEDSDEEAELKDLIAKNSVFKNVQSRYQKKINNYL